MATSFLETFFLLFSVMAIVLTVAALFFVLKTTKLKNKKELQEKRMEIIDKHFSEMTRIECPYCKTLYSADSPECPNCKSPTKKILFPEISD
jgi:uncharacterized paraquat-inducible protein A